MLPLQICSESQPHLTLQAHGKLWVALLEAVQLLPLLVVLDRRR